MNKTNNKLKLFFVILTLCVIVFFFLYNRTVDSSPKEYFGHIRLEPESERSKAYISFHLENISPDKPYMVLLINPKIYKVIEGMINKKVKVKAILYNHEPLDFDKIEILEIKEIK